MVLSPFHSVVVIRGRPRPRRGMSISREGTYRLLVSVDATGGGMIGRSRNDSSTIRAIPSASGDARSIRNFSTKSSARSERAVSAQARHGVGKRAWLRHCFGRCERLGQHGCRVEEDFKRHAKCPGNSPEACQPGACWCCRAQFDKAQSAKSWHDWPIRRVPNLWSSVGLGFVLPSSWIASFGY